QPGRRCTNALSNGSQEAHSVFERTTIATFASNSGEKFMPQISVTMFNVHELKPCLRRLPRRPHEIFDKVVDVAVAHQWRVLIEAELAMQQRDVVKTTWCHPAGGVRLTETC